MKNQRKTGILMLVLSLAILLAGWSKKGGEDHSLQPQPTEDPKKEVVIKGTSLNDNQSVVVIDDGLQKEGYAVDSVYFYKGDTMLVVLTDADSKSMVAIYDYVQGQYTKWAKIDNEAYIDQVLFCDNGMIFLGTSWANIFYYLDDQLNVIFTSQDLTGGYASMAPVKEGGYFYYLDAKEKNLFSYDIEKRESSQIMPIQTEYEHISISDVTSDGVYIIGTYSDEIGILQTILIEPSKKKLLPMEGIGNNIVTGQNMIYLTDYEKTANGYMEYFQIDNPRVVHKFYFDNKTEGNNFYVDGSDGLLLSIKNNIGEKEEKDALTLQLYDMKQGMLIRSTNVSREKLFSYAGYTAKDSDPVNDWFFYTPSAYGLNEDQTLAYFTYFVNGTTNVMLWDLTKENEVALTQSGTAFYTNNAITEQDNDEYVERLNKKYGITIYIRNQVVKFFPDFAVNALYNEETTNEALKELEKLLSRFPEGFFKNMKYGDISGLEIYLCGTLVQGSDNGIQNPGGFALQYKGKQMIVMDATYPSGLVQSISHEIMHAIDARLDYMVNVRGKVNKNVFTKWNKLNPKGYDYKYSYVDEEGVEYNAYNNAAYTPTDEKSLEDVNNIYFLDYYSNTFPIEDRARIFEYLMNANTELSFEFKSTHIQEKAKMLCKMIRLAIPSLPKDEVMYWEKYLE